MHEAIRLARESGRLRPPEKSGDDVIIGGHGNGKDKYFGGKPGAEFGLGTNG